MYYDTKLEAKVAMDENNRKSGEQFESLVFSRLKRCPGHWGLFTNLYIPTGQSSDYNEVDVLMIHETGIYVIECKDHKGTVEGEAGARLWHTRYKSGKEFPFYNPIRQNRDHIAILSRLLGVPKSAFRSWIVFGSLADELNVPESTSEYTITKFMNFSSKITRTIENAEQVFSEEEVDELYDTLDNPRYMLTEEKRKKHCERIRSIWRK